MNDDRPTRGARQDVRSGDRDVDEAGPEAGADDRDLEGARDEDRNSGAGGVGGRSQVGGGEAGSPARHGEAGSPARPGRAGSARRLIVLTAPSGGGKTTVARRVMQAVPELQFSVSATTRPPRSYERHGVDYHFVSPEVFRGYVESGDLLEYEEVYPGVFYGTLRDEVERRAAESPILLDIDVHGAQAVKKIYGDDALVIFIRPPSFEVLASRLHGRATEDPAARKTRLDRVRKELEFADRFDAVVVNDDVEIAVAETLDLIRQFLNG